jgi:hypothetical protein
MATNEPSKPPVDWESIVRKPKVVPRPKSDPTKWIVVGLLGTITACVLLATMVYVVLPLLQANSQSRVATARLPTAKLSVADRAKAAPARDNRVEKAPPRMLVADAPHAIDEPAVILSAKYWDSVYYVPSYSRYSGACFRIAVQLKSQSPKPLESVSYRVRSIRTDRQVREYETSSKTVAIRGGLNPGETIEHVHTVNIEDLNGFNYPLTLPDGAVLQISVDGQNWVEAIHVDNPDDQHNQANSELNRLLGQ